MYAMQYEITLPADYDMDIIHRRVATRGQLTDDFPGLGLKAYLVRERAGGSPVNQYAPFYVWAGIGGMNRFLWGGGGFGGIVRDFGRPAVRHWTGVACLPGPGRTAVPLTATRHTWPIAEDVDPAAVTGDLLADLTGAAAREGAHTTVLAIDPRSWELVHVTLWAGEPPPDAPGTRYQVLHLSAPHLPDLPPTMLEETTPDR